MMNNERHFNILFVCLGNICRSPTAHGVFEQLVEQAGLGEKIFVDSAGTGEWHVGRPPDPRTVQAAQEKGVDLSPLRARQVTAEDFARFDYVLAMDRSNLADLAELKPADYPGHLGLFLPFAAASEPVADEVPDPYFGELDGFDEVYQLVHQGAAGLLEHLRRRLAGTS